MILYVVMKYFIYKVNLSEKEREGAHVHGGVRSRGGGRWRAHANEGRGEEHGAQLQA